MTDNQSSVKYLFDTIIEDYFALDSIYLNIDSDEDDDKYFVLPCLNYTLKQLKDALNNHEIGYTWKKNIKYKYTILNTKGCTKVNCNFSHKYELSFALDFLFDLKLMSLPD